MAFHVITADITKAKTDAVVNSLGLGEDRIVAKPGAIFSAILAEADDGLRDEVYQKGKDLDKTEVFITGSHGLPCKYIVHVITPFRKDDTEELDDLCAAYEGLLDEAYAYGIRSIMMPLLGTGANGYPQALSFVIGSKAAKDAVKKYPDFEVYFNAYWGIQNNAYYREISYRALHSGERDEREEMFERESRRPSQSWMEWPPEEGYFPPQIDFRAFPLKIGDSLGKLIDYYFIAQEGSDDKTKLALKWGEFMSLMGDARSDALNDEDAAFGGQNLKNRWHKKMPAGQKRTPGVHYGEEDPNGTWSRPDTFFLFLACGILGMNRKQTEFVFKFCGYYLSRYRKEDVAVKECMFLLSEDGEPIDYLEAYKIYEIITGKHPFATSVKDAKKKKKGRKKK